jgi:Zn-dependent protease
MEGRELAPMLLTVALVAYSIILHEIAHGYAALKFGDETAKRMNRLTLNPIEHIDPIGTIVFPLIQYATTGTVFIGWAKPVPVNPNHLHPRVPGDIVVSLAGVFVNFLIAVAMSIVLGLVWNPDRMLSTVLFSVMSTNIALIVFNLLPVPPLDGSHVAKYFMPPALREQYVQIGFYGTFILLALIASGVLDPVMRPPIRFLTSFLIKHISLPMAHR